jgi:PAS domain-containing protein
MAADITERQRAKEAVIVSRDELRRALEFDEAVMANMGEGLYTVDVHGLVTFMNPAAERLLGWTFGELRGRKMHDVAHYKHRDGTAFPAEDCAGFRVLHLRNAGPCCFDEVVAGLPNFSWGQIFVAVHRMARDRRVFLRNGYSTYRISLSPRQTELSSATRNRVSLSRSASSA